MSLRSYDLTSRVEERAVERSGKPLRFEPAERLGVVEVSDFPFLGQLVALRFLEWCQRNPEGSVSLPTGKTPEHFIKWTARILRTWNEKDTQNLLGEWGLDAGRKPDMPGMRFVQIDEFYPMNPQHENGFGHYIKRFYFKEFGFDPARAMMMDCWTLGAPAGKDLGWVFPDGKVDLTLRYRAPRGELQALQAQAIVAADQAAMEFEARLEELGGLGFFLGGIGPDGHIGFNIRGSDHFSTTRFMAVNYETAAAAATDLGGIEVARDKVIVTIGLRTITANPTATAIVIAAGEGKARVCREAIELPPSVLQPASALQHAPGGRFYLTKGAASQLSERRRHALAAQPQLPVADLDRILIDLAYAKRKKLVELSPADLKDDRLAALLPQDAAGLAAFARVATERIEKKIAKGREPLEGYKFLHTGPHHDDIMLGYLPYIVHLVRSAKNTHTFATLTSGFTSVTNAYVLSLFGKLEHALERGLLEPALESGYYAPDNLAGRSADVYRYLDGVASRNEDMQEEAEARRMLRYLIALSGKRTFDALKPELARFQDYLRSRYPGQKDTKEVQSLKGMVREWEEELTWAHLGFDCEHVLHLRLGFYTGDIFTPQPEFDRDVEPVLELLRQTDPDILTVTLDPEGAGPDTHYKVLQATSEALKLYLKERPGKKMRVWGYRNVWYRFHPAEATLYVPVSMNALSTMRSAFHTCYGSQRAASFPSPEYDGPFCDLAQRILVEQYATIQNALGKEYFHQNAAPHLRASRGLNFLVDMEPEEFFQRTRALKQLTERSAT
ncbi:MAG: glucosamine-6-phosphate deaminase [Planctomycetota bacterium]